MPISLGSFVRSNENTLGDAACPQWVRSPHLVFNWNKEIKVPPGGFLVAYFPKFGTLRNMRGRHVAGHEEASLIRSVSPDYARRAAQVVKVLEQKAAGGARDHLSAVRAGLKGQEPPPKRTED